MLSQTATKCVFEIQVAALMSGAPVFVILTICREHTHHHIRSQPAAEEKLTRNRRRLVMTSLDKIYEASYFGHRIKTILEVSGQTHRQQ